MLLKGSTQGEGEPLTQMYHLSITASAILLRQRINIAI
jgi:hypothetical protein